MRFGSVCSGIEAATLAWEPLGFKPVFYSEIDPFCCALLSHYYETPNYGDMTEYRRWKDESIDILVGGTPCQSFSVAGLRKGLDDPRGNLALVYLGIVDRYRPRWVVWENVPGILSSNEGRDFGAFLGALEQLGYGWAYRTLDAQFFRVPQRRRRVFVVGCLGGWRGAAAVLFEPESLSGNTPPSREKGKRVADSLTVGANQYSGFNGEPVSTSEITASPEGISGACSSKWHKGTGGPAGDEHYNLIAHEVSPAIGASGRGFERASESRGQDPVVAFECKSGQETGHVVSAVRAQESVTSQNAIAFSCKDSGHDSGEISPSRRAMNHDSSHANAGGQVAVAYMVHGEHSTAMTCKGKARVAEPVSRIRCLDSSGGYATNQGGNVVRQSMQVRRLTPLECERLQGLPDNYTLIKFKGHSKNCASRTTLTSKVPFEIIHPECDCKMPLRLATDSPRYKAIGNSMAVPVMRWIGRRIKLFEQCERQAV